MQIDALPDAVSAHRLRLLGGICLLLGLLLGVYVYQDRIVPGELGFLRLTHRPPSEALDHLAWGASRLGDTFTGLTTATVLGALWCFGRGRPDLTLFIVAASASRVLNTPLKWLFDSSRPPLDLHAIIEPVDGLGYPSGHTFGAVLVYGAIVLAVPQTLPWPWARWLARAVCVLLMLLIPWSRMRLGVHWPSDVAGGFLFGVGVLALLWALTPWVWERIGQRRGFLTTTP